MGRKLSFSEKAIKRLNKNKRIDNLTGCWIWIGRNRTKDGYGRLSIDSDRILVHRLSLFLYRGFDYKSKLLVLHKKECNNPRCFNPEHLYIGTHKDNSQDAIDLGHVVKHEYCIHGHKIDSLYRDDQRRGKIRRYCRQCRIERVRKWRSKQSTETP